MTASVEEQTKTDAEPQQGEAQPAKRPDPRAQSNGHADEYASFDDLLSKPAREKDITVSIAGKALKMHLRALGHVAYDRLQAECPPTDDDKRKGLIYHDDTFGPKLIAAVVTRPKMDLDRATRLWNDPNWAGGEIGGLYRACVEICQVGLDVPFTATG